LDDVFIRDQSCLPNGDIDFENGFGTWSLDKSNSDTIWLLASGDSDDPLRPSVDQSTASIYGSYIYINNEVANKQAYLVSEVFQPTSPRGILKQKSI
jgi:hypothetical protein